MARIRDSRARAFRYPFPFAQERSRTNDVRGSCAEKEWSPLPIQAVTWPAGADEAEARRHEQRSAGLPQGIIQTVLLRSQFE